MIWLEMCHTVSIPSHNDMSQCRTLSFMNNAFHDMTRCSTFTNFGHCRPTDHLQKEVLYRLTYKNQYLCVSFNFAVNFQTPLRGALIFISFIGLCFVAVRSYLYMKKKLFPDVPEPSHKHRVWVSIVCDIY